MQKASLIVVVSTVLMLAGCTPISTYSPPVGETVPISANVENAFKQYQADIGTTHPGAFAVTRSGRGSFYSYCTDTNCNQGIVFVREAISRCEMYGEPCYIFANGHDASYPYRVVN
jgi:hypothetical protein